MGPIASGASVSMGLNTCHENHWWERVGIDVLEIRSDVSNTVALLLSEF